MKLYFYELYKLLSKKMFVLLFVLVFAANITVFIIAQNTNKTEQDDYSAADPAEYAALLENYRDMPVKDALRDAKEKRELYSMCSDLEFLLSDSSIPAEEAEIELHRLENSDSKKFRQAYEMIKSGEDYSFRIRLYNQVTEQLEYIQKYDTFIYEMEERAEKQLTFSIFAEDDSFAFNNIQKTPHDFEQLKGIRLIAADYTGIEKGTDFYITDLFAVALIFVMCIYIFSQERDKSLLILIKSTKNGHTAAALTKIFSLLTYLFAACILLYGSDILLSGSMYGFGELNAPVQSIKTFMNCSMKLTVLEYLLLWLGFKILTTAAVGCVFAAVFMLLKNSAEIYALCAAMIAAEYMLYRLIPAQSAANHLKYINIVYFMRTRDLIRNYLNLNFFTAPINIYPLYFSICILLILVFSFLTVFAFSKQKQIASRNKIMILLEMIREKFFRIRGSVSIFGAEIYKLFVQEKMWIILLIALMVGIHSSLGTFPDSFSSISEAAYHSYIQTLEGKADDEKRAFLEKEQKYYDDVFDEYMSLSAIENKTFDQNDRLETLQLIIEGKYKGFEKLNEYYGYLCDQNEKYGTAIYFIDESKYGNILSDSFSDWQRYIFSILILTAALGNIFAYEHKRNMSKLLKSTEKGKYRLCAAKYSAAALTALLTFVIIYIPCLIKFFRQYGYIIGEAPASCMRIFENSPHGMTILGLLIGMYFIRLMILLSFAIIIASLSELFGNYFLTMTVSTVIFGFSGILLYGNHKARIYSLIGSGNTWLTMLLTAAAIIGAAIFSVSAVCRYSGTDIKGLFRNKGKKKGADKSGA